MICYHGTTRRRAERICQNGFIPRKPSRRVWFAKGHGYALRRARQQATRSRGHAVVLSCDINLPEFRRTFGKNRVFYKNGIIAVSAPVPASVLRSYTGWGDQPSSPDDIAKWLNHILRLKPWKGVNRRHPGVERLSRWVVNRLRAEPRRRIRPAAMVEKAEQWLPEFFEGVEIDHDNLHAHYKLKAAEIRAPEPEPILDPLDEEALGLLGDVKPGRRVRGLEMLAELGDPDLFDWCAMFLNDRSVNVRIAALHATLKCEEGDAQVIAPLADAENKRVRGAAIAALTALSGDGAPRWFRRGLKDPDSCVRLETAAQLSRLDPTEHHRIFDLARYDPNPDVARRAEKLTTGKGFPRMSFRHDG